jgi:hypothetical protein
MRTILAVVIMWMLCSAALAEEISVIRGVGTGSCAEFASTYNKNATVAELVYDSWGQGFMSGLNAELGSKREPMRNIPPSTNEFSRIRHACDEHPQAAFWEIVFDYFLSLPEIPPPSR